MPEMYDLKPFLQEICKNTRRTQEILCCLLNSSIYSINGVRDITPDDDVEFAVTKGLRVTGSGDIHVTFEDGSEGTITNVPVNINEPYRVIKVWASGTSATGIKALY